MCERHTHRLLARAPRFDVLFATLQLSEFFDDGLSAERLRERLNDRATSLYGFYGTFIHGFRGGDSRGGVIDHSSRGFGARRLEFFA